VSDMSWIGPLIQAGASAMGEQKAGQLSAQQQQILKDIYENLRDTPLPDLKDVKAEQLGPTAMEGVHSDPQQRQQQLEVMSALRDMFEHGGFNIEDRAALSAALNEANVKGSAQRHMLQGEFAQRGQLGAGARLALGNMDAQGAANRSSQAALDVAAQGEKRRMAALGDYGNMAGHLRSQDFDEAQARATAKDAADRWNASAREKAGYYNAGLPQQQFTNQVTKATGQQGAGNNLSSYYGNEAQGVRNQYANHGRAAAEASKGFGSGGGGSSSGEGVSAEQAQNASNSGSPAYGDDGEEIPWWENGD
jgi:hypothetical protein